MKIGVTAASGQLGTLILSELAGLIGTDNIVTVALHEYQSIWRDLRRARNWRDRLRYLFLAPGWSHDGPDKRANTLRRELAAD